MLDTTDRQVDVSSPVVLLHGDVEDTLKLIPDNSCDAVITRPRKPRGTNTVESIRGLLVVEDHGYLTACATWPYSRYPVADGYGRVRFEGKTRSVHKLLWEAVNGPVPAGMELDHLCRVQYCAELTHLDPVAHRVNVLRGSGLTARNAHRDTCLAGHPLAGSNLKVRVHSDGQKERMCIQCNRDRAAEYNQRVSAARRAL